MKYTPPLPAITSLFSVPQSQVTQGLPSPPASHPAPISQQVILPHVQALIDQAPGPAHMCTVNGYSSTHPLQTQVSALLYAPPSLPKALIPQPAINQPVTNLSQTTNVSSNTSTDTFLGFTESDITEANNKAEMMNQQLLKQSEEFDNKSVMSN